jgi:hypothetical protein
MTVLISDDSANVIALFADWLGIDPEQTVLSYERLCGRECRPTEADATDATCQAILNSGRGPAQSDEPSLEDQRKEENQSDYIDRVLAEIRG